MSSVPSDTEKQAAADALVQHVKKNPNWNKTYVMINGSNTLLLVAPEDSGVDYGKRVMIVRTDGAKLYAPDDDDYLKYLLSNDNVQEQVFEASKIIDALQVLHDDEGQSTNSKNNIMVHINALNALVENNK